MIIAYTYRIRIIAVPRSIVDPSNNRPPLDGNIENNRLPQKIAHPSPIFSFFYTLPVKLNWILIQQNRINDDSSFDAEDIDTQIS